MRLRATFHLTRNTIQLNEPMIIRDSHLDPRFANSPLVLGDPFIRFYIGAPLNTPAGYNIGALCAMNTVPHDPTAEQIKLLQDLGPSGRRRVGVAQACLS